VIGWDRERMPSQFAMIVRSSETPAGYCGFFHHEVDGKMEIEIGYRLDSACWNRGLASEAARTVRDHGFRDYSGAVAATGVWRRVNSSAKVR
jgi:ribosomal-protein-alanine N-acetyltransferase